jgi:hypothetical protein
MKMWALLLGGLVLAPLLFFPQSLRAQANGCALLKPTDLTMLLGGTPIAKPNAGACSWTASGGTRKFLAAKLRAAGPAAAMVFAAARKSAARNGAVTVTDEPGLGDKAFASLESFGVALVMLKQGRLLQLQYWTGAAGTAKDLDALRPVAKKAITAF